MITQHINVSPPMTIQTQRMLQHLAKALRLVRTQHINVSPPTGIQIQHMLQHLAKALRLVRTQHINVSPPMTIQTQRTLQHLAKALRPERTQHINTGPPMTIQTQRTLQHLAKALRPVKTQHINVSPPTSTTYPSAKTVHTEQEREQISATTCTTMLHIGAQTPSDFIQCIMCDFIISVLCVVFISKSNTMTCTKKIAIVESSSFCLQCLCWWVQYLVYYSFV